MSNSDFIKCIIIDKGDPSVGIFETTWEVDSPWNREDIEDEDAISERDLEWFREKVKDLYSEFTQGRVSAIYDFEIDEMEAALDSGQTNPHACPLCKGTKIAPRLKFMCYGCNGTGDAVE